VFASGTQVDPLREYGTLVVGDVSGDLNDDLATKFTQSIDPGQKPRKRRCRSILDFPFWISDFGLPTVDRRPPTADHVPEFLSLSDRHSGAVWVDAISREAAASHCGETVGAACMGEVPGGSVGGRGGGGHG
jgi:hypothetical protein